LIDPGSKRIAGVYFEDDGNMAAVWLAHDDRADRLHVYDACLFRQDVPAVHAEGLNARGRWIPIVWPKEAKPLADKLSARGCEMTLEPYEETELVAHAISNDIDERMRTARFKVEKRLAVWLDEYKNFHTRDGKVPLNGFPLMSATRAAVALFDEWARPQHLAGHSTPNHPKIAVV